jgi:hypothetical protein
LFSDSCGFSKAKLHADRWLRVTLENAKILSLARDRYHSSVYMGTVQLISHGSSSRRLEFSVFENGIEYACEPGNSCVSATVSSQHGVDMLPWNSEICTVLQSSACPSWSRFKVCFSVETVAADTLRDLCNRLQCFTLPFPHIQICTSQSIFQIAKQLVDVLSPDHLLRLLTVLNIDGEHSVSSARGGQATGIESVQFSSPSDSYCFGSEKDVVNVVGWLTAVALIRRWDNTTMQREFHNMLAARKPLTELQYCGAVKLFGRCRQMQKLLPPSFATGYREDLMSA